MSAVQVIDPLVVIQCDDPYCDAEFEPTKSWDRGHERPARRAAKEAGWQTRPVDGKGARTAPDLCPAHRTDGTR